MKFRHLVWIPCLALGCARTAPPPPPMEPFFAETAWPVGRVETSRYRAPAETASLVVEDTVVRWCGGATLEVVAERRTGAVLSVVAAAEGETRSLRRIGPGVYLLDWGGRRAPIEFDPATTVVCADALPIWLRTLPQVATHRRKPHRVALLPSLATRAAPGNYRRSEAAVQIHNPEEIVVPAGRFRARRATVNHAGGGEEVYWIEEGGDRRILRILRLDGSSRERTP